MRSSVYVSKPCNISVCWTDWMPGKETPEFQTPELWKSLLESYDSN